MVKYRLSNYLICPQCKEFPLKLHILKVEEYPDRKFKFKPCDEYCSYIDKRGEDIKDPPCDECIKKEIIDGFYTCPKCDIWFPIIDAIAIMHLGKYRPKKVIKEFIEKYREKIPQKYIDWELSNFS